MAKRAKGLAGQSKGREVIYSTIQVDVGTGENAITVDDAKHLLGWEEITKGEDYIKEIYSLAKIKVKCTNNVTNRPIYTTVIQTLKQEILRGRWTFNGEPIIVGKTGLILNGQHTLISLVLSHMEWEEDPIRFFETWKEQPVIEKLVVSGVDESDSTVNTMDTCKPRSLADVIYRSKYFASVSSGDRRRIARITDYAVRLLWYRTGAKMDAFAPKLTHSEALAFIEHHPKLLEAVSHVHEEDGKEKRITKYVSPGYAAGLLYLMGSSTTNPREYRVSTTPDEASLDWDNWDKACDFFVLLASEGPETEPVRKAMAASLEEGGLGMIERWSIIVNAWLSYSSGEKITVEALNLKYVNDRHGIPRLAEHPSVGGIDLGDPSNVDEESMDMNDPSPEELEKEVAKARKKKLSQKSKEGAPPKKAVKKVKRKVAKKRVKSKDWNIGDRVWVVDPRGEPWKGEIIELTKNGAELSVAQGFQGCGTIRKVWQKHLSKTQPDVKA